MTHARSLGFTEEAIELLRELARERRLVTMTDDTWETEQNQLWIDMRNADEIDDANAAAAGDVAALARVRMYFYLPVLS